MDQALEAASPGAQKAPRFASPETSSMLGFAARRPKGDGAGV